MIKLQSQMYLWAIAGMIFILVSIRDIFFAGVSDKSSLIISFEVIAGLCFTLLAIIQWRKSKNQKAA